MHSIKMCMILPSVIQEVVADADNITNPHDTVIEEVQRMVLLHWHFICLNLEAILASKKLARKV